jgi:hypothetical protein
MDHGPAPVERAAWFPRAARSLRSPVLIAASVCAACAACGGGEATPDASPDTPPDMMSRCGADLLFTGEIVDWDSVGDCGVAGARVTVRGTPAQTDDSNFNGRFEVCVPHQGQTVVDVMQSASPSRCAKVAGAYPVRGIFIANPAVIDLNALSFSARAMTQARQDAMFMQIGPDYSATLAQLLVHVAGTPRAVSISSPHGVAQSYNGSAWVAGDSGDYVLFPNANPGATTITVAGGAVGTGTVTLEADAYTYVTVIAN